MTALPVGTNLSGATAMLDNTVRALVRGHNDRAYTLPKDVCAATVAADALARRSAAVGAEHRQLKETGISAAHAAALEAAIGTAASGTVAADVAEPVHVAATRLSRLAVEAEFMNTAARQATIRLGTLVQSGSAIGEVLDAALQETLAAAAKHAPLVAGVRLGDPGALMKASAAAQAAFRSLEPLARRHDALRSASVALALWADVEALTGPGSGVEDHRRLATGPHGGGAAWVFRPVGHPVARLVEAAGAAETVAEVASIAPASVRRGDGSEFIVERGSEADRALHAQGAVEIEGPGGNLVTPVRTAAGVQADVKAYEAEQLRARRLANRRSFADTRPLSDDASSAADSERS